MNPLKSLKSKFQQSTIHFDLSQRADRRKLLVWLGIVVLAGVGFLFGGVQLYDYSENSVFCGTVCHSMDPQWVRYQQSPHANVRCTECHIGPGASFFVRSKVDGLRQVVAETLHTYDAPIKSPIHNLRPARETCEECHSPTNFKDNIVKTKLHFDNDEKNTPLQTTLILKMGGTQQMTGKSNGIHWHISGKVYYVADDTQRQDIVWVGVEQPDGTLKEYFRRDMTPAKQAAFMEQARANGQVRTMDCIDCHNRTAHYIPSPQEAVDKAIEDGLIARDLPYIRSKAVAVLSQSYGSQAEAYAAIDALSATYMAKNGLIIPPFGQQAKVNQAIDTLKQIYSTTNFPDMGLNWQVNPNNEKHTPFLGCFRCHDGNHVLAGTSGGSAQAIGVECNLCHTVPITGRGDQILVEAPVIVGSAPASHTSYSWTIEHRSTTEAEKQQCAQCHGQGFCNNGACHNLSHPENMFETHPDEYAKQGGLVCQTCHQDIFCEKCHPGGVIQNP